jgi:hypothetical protein
MDGLLFMAGSFALIFGWIGFFNWRDRRKVRRGLRGRSA